MPESNCMAETLEPTYVSLASADGYASALVHRSRETMNNAVPRADLQPDVGWWNGEGG